VVLRRIFGPKGQKVTRGGRRLHNEELHNVYASLNFIRVIQSRRMRWAGHVACMGEMRSSNKILDGKPEGKRPRGRPRCRWEDYIRMDIKEIWWKDIYWIRLAQDRDQWRTLVNTVVNFRFP
jgi:hypothetical protein